MHLTAFCNTLNSQWLHFFISFILIITVFKSNKSWFILYGLYSVHVAIVSCEKVYSFVHFFFFGGGEGWVGIYLFLCRKLLILENWWSKSNETIITPKLQLNLPSCSVFTWHKNMIKKSRFTAWTDEVSVGFMSNK